MEVKQALNLQQILRGVSWVHDRLEDIDSHIDRIKEREGDSMVDIEIDGFNFEASAKYALGLLNTQKEIANKELAGKLAEIKHITKSSKPIQINVGRRY